MCGGLLPSEIPLNLTQWLGQLLLWNLTKKTKVGPGALQLWDSL